MRINLISQHREEHSILQDSNNTAVTKMGMVCIQEEIIIVIIMDTVDLAMEVEEALHREEEESPMKRFKHLM